MPPADVNSTGKHLWLPFDGTSLTDQKGSYTAPSVTVPAGAPALVPNASRDGLRPAALFDNPSTAGAAQTLAVAVSFTPPMTVAAWVRLKAGADYDVASPISLRAAEATAGACTSFVDFSIAAAAVWQGVATQGMAAVQAFSLAPFPWSSTYGPAGTFVPDTW